MPWGIPTTPPHPLHILMPNSPTNANYFEPPPPEEPLLFDEPQSLLQTMRANPPVKNHPMVDPLEDGAWPWTTSPPNVETETIIITTTTLDPCPELKIHRTIPMMHWLGKVNSTFKKPFTGFSSLGLEDALDCRLDPNIFSTLATLLRTTVFTLDNLPAHLSSHSSTTFLLHTTLPFSNNSIPTLVNSGAMDNFIDEFLAVLAPHLLWCIPTPILLKLFDSDPTPAGDITHCLEITMIFTNRWQQELQLLVMKLHPSAPIDNPANSGLVPFNVSLPSENSKTMINHSQTPPQLCSRSAQSFIINVQLDSLPKVLPALINSSASSTFVSSQLKLQCNNLNKPLELQLFDRSSATTGITQYHDNTLTLNNDLQFQAWLLVTQLPLSTPIVLRLLWLQDVNPDNDWKNLTMQFPSPKASLVAAIPLHLQSILDSDVFDSGTSTFGATQHFLTSNAEHPEHICCILEQLWEYHLHAKPKKCSFHMTEVEYLGVIVTPNSMHMDPTKVNAILNWPPLQNVKEKDALWDWDSKCQSVFLLLKKAFTSALVLHHFDSSLLIILKCDTSDYAIARILSQSDSGGKDLHPVAFYTCSIISMELNYDIYNKELLAIVEAFQQWWAYLEGSLHYIQVYSNHNNLQYFTTTKQLSCC
ncbi:hypothetical protein E4T56_gene4666 [Termitomyces sp. T112]|nr:hypothetical protein E4T56_gene4666 [Termitomyces sp. T112]